MDTAGEMDDVKAKAKAKRAWTGAMLGDTAR
jgi:hypothetical protein